MADDQGTRVAWWLAGNFAPVTDEVEAFDLKVEGALPPELTGVFMRNGPNPKSGHSPHWFMGDGMLHGVRIERGQAKWYRNRYIRSRRFTDPPAQGDMARRMDRTDSTGNTNVVRHAGRILALEEAHFPIEMGADLSTKGAHDFGGALKGAFTAHPKFCPETGEMLAFGYGFMPPYLTYYRFDPAGRLVQAEEIPVGGPTMIHDFCVTRTRAIFMDLPIVFDLEIAMKGGMPYRWSDEYPARLGVMPRNGSASELRWYDIPPCYVFHPMNAYDDGDKIVFDVARFDRLWDKKFIDSPQKLTRWTIDPASGRVSQDVLDDAPVDFPRVSDARAGLKHRYGYAAELGDTADVSFANSVLKYDLQTGAIARCNFGAGRHPGEFVHAPAPGGEDAGWLMGFVHDEPASVTRFCVLDATNVEKGPIAQVALPQRAPYGFHGNWFAD